METPKTLQEAIQFYNSYENCKEYMVAKRWPNGVSCPTCGSTHVVYLESVRRWKCYSKHAKPQFSLKTGTIFEDSPLGLEKWLPVMWLLANSKNGVSSWEIHRGLGITQKTAWFMLQRARLAAQDPETGGKLGGEVEVDETFIGGLARNMHKNVKERKIQGRRGVEGKAIVAAVLERGSKGNASRVVAKVVDSRRKPQLQALVRENVEPKSALFSDALKSYDGLSEDFAHQVVDHAVEYVNGNIHTNGCENFWSLLKRGIRGTYVSVEPYHLFRYVDEQAFRFNNRKLTDSERFDIVMGQIVGKRLTYKELIGSAEEQAATL
jgi:transposase-like protein